MKHHQYFQFSILFLLVNSFAFASHASILSLSDYLRQIESLSPAIDASKKNSEGALLASLEGGLSTKPSFFAQTSHLLDKKLAPNPFSGNVMTSDTFSAGIQEQFAFGLNAKLSYTVLSSDTGGLPATFYPGGKLHYSNAISQLDFSQPLWRNFLGKETKANATLIESNSLMMHFAESFKSKQLRAQAEVTYYRLSIAREAVKLQTEVLDRSKKILEWTTKRSKNQLADKADMLQAKAACQARELELQAQLDEERSARLAFNAIRNQVNDEVADELTPLSTDQVVAIEVPQKSKTPDDVLAAEQNEKIVTASNELSMQKGSPDLSLFGTLAYNGLDNYLSPAMSQAFSADHPTYMIGLKFSSPIYFWETTQVRSGRVKEQLASEAQTRQKRLESDQTWEDLTKRIRESKNRLKLASSLVDIQKEKLDYEKYRLNLGRTTTYQVLLFEQDYAQALITRLRNENEILTLNAQLKPLAL